MVASSVILTVVLLWLIHPLTVTGFSSFLDTVRLKYPAMGSTRIDNCTLCHVTIAPLVLNPFGTAFHENGQNDAALTAIANLDSDLDGWTNLQEITALTYPGDASDHPVTVLNFKIFVPALNKE